MAADFLLQDWLTENTLFAIPLWNWGLAALLGASSFLLMLASLKFAVSRLNTRSSKVPAKILKTLAELLSATNWILLGLASLIIGLSALKLSDRGAATVAHLWFIVLAVQIGLWLNRAVAIWNRDHLPRLSGANTVMTTLLAFFVQAVVWIIVLLAILDNAGVNITALVASLGIGGVAIALAVQTILGDLFASISIGVDKPFQVGDFIVVGDTSGSIEHIGLKSTRIRSLGGEQVICSNTELLKRTIQNFKRMTERRVAFRFNLPYRTPPDKVEKIPAMVKELIRGLPATRFGRAHFVKLGSAALEFEAVYTVLDADYDRYMDIQQSINLGILRQLDAMAVDFALPDGRQASAAEKFLPNERPEPAVELL